MPFPCRLDITQYIILWVPFCLVVEENVLVIILLVTAYLFVKGFPTLKVVHLIGRNGKVSYCRPLSCERNTYGSRELIFITFLFLLCHML